MQGTATTKQNPVSFFWIQSPTDLIPCMEEVGSLGYSCVNTSTVGVDGQLIWELTINGPTQTGLTAMIGEVVAWDGMKLDIFPDSDSFLAKHDIVSTS